MSLQFSTTYRNAALDLIESTVSTSAKLNIFTGTAPANVGTAASGTLIAQYSLASDWAAAASGGTKALNNLPLSTTALATGSAGYFRIYDSANSVCTMQGTVANSGADLNVDNSTINSGQTINITAFTITAPGA